MKAFLDDNESGWCGETVTQALSWVGRITLLGTHINIIIGGVPLRHCPTHTHALWRSSPSCCQMGSWLPFSRSENIAWVYQWLLVRGFPPPQRIKPHSSEITQWVLMYYQSRCFHVATESSSTHCCQNGWSFPYCISSDSHTWDCIASAFVFLEEFWNKWSIGKMSFSGFEKVYRFNCGCQQ